MFSSNLNFDLIKMVCILTFERITEKGNFLPFFFLSIVKLCANIWESCWRLCYTYYVCLDVKMPSSPNDKTSKWITSKSRGCECECECISRFISSTITINHGELLFSISSQRHTEHYDTLMQERSKNWRNENKNKSTSFKLVFQWAF